jgi:hypothetical protein
MNTPTITEDIEKQSKIDPLKDYKLHFISPDFQIKSSLK